MMKLDFHGNSVRVRLKTAELSLLERSGRVGESVQFGPGADQRLVYALELSHRASAPQTRFRNGILTITLPSEMATHWLRGNEPSLQTEQLLDPGNKLTLHIEKELSQVEPLAYGIADYDDRETAPPLSRQAIPV
jgi:hypothetical protein